MALRAGAVGATCIVAVYGAVAETTTTDLHDEKVETSASITARDLMTRIKTLASDQMAGRESGTPGGALAEDHVAAAFRRLGLAPAGENGSYFQKFGYVSGVRIGPGSRLRARIAPAGGDPEGVSKVFQTNVDWRPLGYSRIGAAAPNCVVFAGYGLKRGREGRPGFYDSYAGAADVKGCWALVWRGAPPDMPPALRRALLRVAGISYKASVARSRGATGLIMADGPGAGYARGLPPLRFGPRMQREDMPVVAISERTAERLMRAGGLDPKAEADARRFSDATLAPRRLKGVEVEARIDLEPVRIIARNVLGRLELGGPAGAAPLLIGAHLDHLGRGGDFTSLARANEQGTIHRGADDNASGVSAMLEIAERFAADKAVGKSIGAGGAKPARDILFAAWMGEELGLLGSGAYVDWRRAPVAAYVNLDMIGRLDQRLKLGGLGSSPDWGGVVERANAPLRLPLTLEQNAYLPTDTTSFYLAGAPVLSVSTGLHADYHSPRDTPELINAGGLEQIAKLIARVLRDRVAAQDPPEFRAMLASSERAARRRGTVYLGVAPAFVPGDRVGAPLLGVIEGSPAAEANFESGDLLIQLAGERVVTLYDLVRILDGLAPDEPVEALVIRGEATLRLPVTPRVRE